MQQLSQANEFANLIKNRAKAGKEMAPIIQKIQAEFAIVLQQASQIKNKFNEVLKFESEKLTLQKYIKQVRRDLHQTNSHLASAKAENELGISKLGSNIRTVKDELHSLERTVERRQEYFQTYDRKLNTIMDSLSKHQSYVNDRLYIFQDKFKNLTKQTLQMTKDIKKDFDNTMTTNIILKNELVHKIKNTEEKEKILDLYMSQREEIPKKINDIYKDLKNYLKHNQFQQFKKWHETAIQQSLSKAKKTVQKIFPQNTQQNLSKIQSKFKQIDELHAKTKQIQILKHQIESLSHKIDSIQKNEDIKITQIREQAEEIEQKIIEVIDKKIQTIEEEIQHYNTQNQQSVDQKLQKIRQQFIKMFDQRQSKRHYQPISEVVITNKATKNIINHQQTQAIVSKEIQTIQKQRQLIEINSKQIKALAQGLNSKLSLFSNRITMCRSDIQIFMQNTTRQLKKIIDIRKQQQNHMQFVGKMFADIMQSILILTSITLNQQQKGQNKSYVTYNDGILLQLDRQSNKNTMHYRKHQINSFDLKDSLILVLLQRVDQLIVSHQIFRWDKYKPSMFFNKIKDHLNIKSKIMSKSASVQIHSPRRKKKVQGEQDLFFDLKMQSEELLKNVNHKPTITINNSNILWSYQKPKSQMHTRYKIKRNQQKTKKQTEERNCFTASKSHRKTKVIFN